MVRLPPLTGSAQALRLAGEGEADAAQGLLSWVAPLAQSLPGRETATPYPFQGGEAEIVAIEP